jgi:hypothetical protein
MRDLTAFSHPHDSEFAGLRDYYHFPREPYRRPPSLGRWSRVVVCLLVVLALVCVGLRILWGTL